MATAAERQPLVDEFLDLAARLEALLFLDSRRVLDPARLRHWKYRYGDEATTLLAHRDLLIATPTIVSTAELEQWIGQSHRVLEVR